jgi:hypothetical protein
MQHLPCGDELVIRVCAFGEKPAGRLAFMRAVVGENLGGGHVKRGLSFGEWTETIRMFLEDIGV